MSLSAVCLSFARRLVSMLVCIGQNAMGPVGAVQLHVKGAGASAVGDSARVGGCVGGAVANGRAVARRGVLSLAVVLLGMVGGSAVAAAPVSAADDCPNAKVRQQQAVGDLPSCMALEMVSPPAKNNAPARINYVNPTFGGASFGAISPDGDRLRFISPGVLAGTPGLMEVTGDWYVASRDDGQQRWKTDYTSPPAGLTRGLRAVPVASSFSADLSRWFQFATNYEQWRAGLSQAFRGELGGSFQAMSPLIGPLSGTPEGPLGQVQIDPPRAAADGSRIYFRPNALIQPGTTISYLPGDPTPAGSGAESNTYVALPDGGGAPSLQLLARDGQGKVWGGNCGAGVGGNPSNARNNGAISVDGSRTYFTTRPDQPPTGDCNNANRRRIMVREDTPGGVEIGELVASECDRVADPGPPEVPACGQVPGGQVVPDGDDLYQGASIDGSKVFFTSSRQLVDSDTNGLDAVGLSGCVGSFGIGIGGCDLYVYDQTRPEGQRLAQVTAGGTGRTGPVVAAISGDGSRVYFNSTDVLTTDPGPGGNVAQAGLPNLYVFERSANHPDGRIAFIASTTAGDAYPVPSLGPDPEILGVGGDGHLLFFTSTVALTGDDTDGSYRDVYRYDDENQTIVRISKAAPGGLDNGPFDVLAGLHPGANIPDNPPDVAVAGRWVSEDGETVAFKTQDRLVASDVNGILDSYLWRDGQPARLPGTADATNGLNVLRGLNDYPLVSVDGNTIAFQTEKRLVSFDRDTAIDVYVVRVGGGFLAPPAAGAGCDAPSGGCQGAGTDPVTVDSRTSSVLDGGDVSQAGRKRLVLAAGLSLRARRVASRRGVLTLRVRSSRAGVVRLVARTATKGPSGVVGRASKRFAKPGSATVTLTLDRRARRVLARGARLDLKIEARASGARARSIPVSLRKAKR